MQRESDHVKIGRPPSACSKATGMSPPLPVGVHARTSHQGKASGKEVESLGTRGEAHRGSVSLKL
jgi:hypothetical protein